MRAIALSVLVVALGCDQNSSVPDGGADSGLDVVVADSPSKDSSTEASIDAGGSAAFCTSETPAVVASGSGFEATTTHYDLYAETTTADATDMARLLEASGAAFASWFQRAQPAQKLKVKYYATQSAWVAGLAADGIQAPAEAGGYYAESTQTAYLFKQGNPYYSHVLLVHEAAHQFHFLTRLQLPSPPFWYVEGHAEYLSRHDWDGQCVRLGVMSLLSWEDLPSDALAEGSIDVAGIIGGTTTASRADAWAIFRYLDTGSYRASFQTYRDAMDSNTSPSFASIVAPPASLSAPITSWLPSAQEPMTPIFTEWIHVGPTAIDVDTPSVFSLAVVKSAVSHLQAKFTVPTSGKYDVGVVVAYTDSSHYVGVVHGNDGVVRTFTANGSAIWNNVGTAPAASNGEESFSVDYSGGQAHVVFNGTTITVPASSPRAGLAANDTTGHFTAISFQ